MEAAGVDPMTKVQPPTAAGGRFTKDRFTIDLRAGMVTCPGHVTVPIRRAGAGGGTAAFGAACAGCPLATQCTSSAAGRTITIHLDSRARIDGGAHLVRGSKAAAREHRLSTV